MALYTSYLLAAWAWRGMEFTVALVLLELMPDSLLRVSIFGLLDNGVRVFFGGVVGSYIDKSPRYQGAVNCFLAQNVCIALAGIGLSAAIGGLIELGSVSYWITVCFSLVLAALASVGSSGIQISVERSMPKVIYADSDVDSETRLSQMNSTFRALDLIALLLSPIASGALMTTLEPWVALFSLAVYALLAWIPEILLLRYAVIKSQLLSAPKIDSDSPLNERNTSRWLVGESWRIYARQPILLACLSLSVLYCTVLSLGFLMTSFLKWSGMSEIELSLFRGFGAFAGLAATVIYPSFQKLVRGSARVGLVGITFQLTLLSAGVLPIFISHFAFKARPPLALVRLLITLVAGSRSGLWLFDLAVTQIVQDNVLPQELGTGSNFPLLMLASLFVVSLSAILYLIWYLHHNVSPIEERKQELEQGNEEAEGLLQSTADLPGNDRAERL